MSYLINFEREKNENENKYRKQIENPEALIDILDILKPTTDIQIYIYIHKIYLFLRFKLQIHVTYILFIQSNKQTNQPK